MKTKVERKGVCIVSRIVLMHIIEMRFHEFCIFAVLCGADDVM